MAEHKSNAPSIPRDSEAIDSRYLRREIKGPWAQVRDMATQKDTMMILLLIFACVILVLPMTYIVLVPGGLGYYAWASRRRYNLPFKVPINWGGPDYGSPVPGRTGKYKRSSGILFFGRDESTLEELWIEDGDARRHGFFIGTTGSGKALPLDTPILTPNGWVMNGDLLPGDRVCHPDGTDSRVESIHPQGPIPGIRIAFEDGREALCSEDHLWHILPNTERVGAEGQKDEDIPNAPPVPPGGRVMEARDLGILFGLYGDRYTLCVPLAKPHTGPEAEHLLTIEAAARAARHGILSLPYMPSSIGTPAQRLSFLAAWMAARQPAMTIETGMVRIMCLPQEDAIAIKQIAWSLGGIARTQTNGATKLDVFVVFPGIETLYAGAGALKMPSGLRIVAVDPDQALTPMSCIKVDREDGLYVMENHITTHNTELLLGVVSQTLMWSSGFVFIDGKGTTEFYARAWTLCKRFGREDDLRILNFTDPGGDPDAPSGGPFTQSNTLNPFSKGTPDQLMNLIVSLMGDAGSGNDMWKQRAESLVTALMMALCELRNKGQIILDVQTIREHLALGKGFDKSKLGLAPTSPGARNAKQVRIEEVPEAAWEEMRNRAGFIELYLRAMNKELSHTTYLALKAFFDTLPGFSIEKALSGEYQEAKCSEQFSFLSMQLTRPLGSLADGYGHIFRTGLGEVDMDDVVLNRRILVVLLPALQKSASEMQNCGKIVVALIKMMMGSASGSTVMGTKREIIDSKQTRADTPYIVVMDEAGYYMVKGVDVMLAQARSLGFMVIIAGQDMQAMKATDKQIAETAAANASILAVGKTVDGGETVDFVQKLMGKAKVSVSAGYSAKAGVVNNKWYDKMDVTFEEVEKVKIGELQAMGEGQFYFLFNGKLVRAQTFYVGNDFAENFSVNKFIKVRGPTDKLPGLDQSVEESMISGLLRSVEKLFSFATKEPEDYTYDDSLAQSAAAMRALLAQSGSQADNPQIIRRASLIGLAALLADPADIEIENDDQGYETDSELENWANDVQSEDELALMHKFNSRTPPTANFTPGGLHLPDSSETKDHPAQPSPRIMPPVQMNAPLLADGATPVARSHPGLPGALRADEIDKTLSAHTGLDQLAYPSELSTAIHRSTRGETERDRHQGILGVLEHENRARNNAIEAEVLDDPMSDQALKEKPPTFGAYYGTLSRQFELLRGMMAQEGEAGDLGRMIMGRSTAINPLPLPPDNAVARVENVLERLSASALTGRR